MWFDVEYATVRKRRKEKNAYLSGLTFDALNNRSKSRLTIAALLASLFVILETVSQSLGAEVEGIAEWLMNGLDRVTPSHKNLGNDISIEVWT